MNSTNSGFMLQTMLFLVNYNTTNVLDTIYDEKIDPPQDSTAKCYGIYGCFSSDGPWKKDNRPQVLPFNPSILDVKYHAFTNRNRAVPQSLNIDDPETILKVGIHTENHIYFIAHGFLESGDRLWVRELTSALLDYEKNATVVVVDWKGGSSPPYYQAMANIRLIGSMTAHIIYAIYDEMKMENLVKVHLIGHSLGAHLQGYCGYHLQTDFGLKVERITALDPAEPFFGETDEIVRLDTSDANYVDVIHSDMSYFVKGGFGMKQKIGHLDFFPNGGSNQPGCDSNSIQIGCNHVRSIRLFTESIHTQCPFQAIECESYEKFLNGECNLCNRNNHLCFKFGFHSRKSFDDAIERKLIDSSSPIGTYLLTSDKDPYCVSHYNISVKISNSEESRRFNGDVGILYFKLRSRTKKMTKKMKFNANPKYFSPGSTHSHLTIGDDIKDIESVIVIYNFIQTINPLTWRIFSSKIFIEYIIVESMEHSTQQKLCPELGTEFGITAEKEATFKADLC